MTLNGWQRLWLVVVALWGITVGAFVVILWPESIYHPPNGYSEEVVADMRVRDWKGKNDCSSAPDGPRKTYKVTAPDGQTQEIISDHMPTEGELEKLFEGDNRLTPDIRTVADAIRQAYPHAYDDLTDQQLEEAVRSKAPKLDQIVRNMISAHESTENIVLVVRHAAESGVKGADVLQPLFARIHVHIEGEKDNDALLCFSGEPKDRAEQITADYYATYSRVLKSKQRKAVAGALAFWLIPSAFIYTLGWSVGWIRRGFGKQQGGR